MAAAQGKSEMHAMDKFEEDFRKTLETSTLDEAAPVIQNYFTKLDSVTLNIAITGENGSGKSSFVNAFRGIGDEEVNSAPAGVVETTLKPKAYPHPKFPKVQLWDLPGIGYPKFTAESYLREVKFERYDFFIIISSQCFSFYNVQLAKEILKMKKRFYFVRSKIDLDVDGERRMQTFDRDKKLKSIRENCIKGLQKHGGIFPEVFLISSHNLSNYDFPLLEETIEMELPKLKRHVLLLSMPNINREINQKKKEALLADAWKLALLSGAVAAVPIPGLSIVVDVSILVREISRYFRAFGLDDESLRNLSVRTKIPFNELKSLLKSPFSKEISADVVIKMLTKTAGAGLMFGLMIPILGSLIAGGMSYMTTLYMLKSCINELAEDTQKVLEWTLLSVDSAKR